ncbi:hypothetical protein CAOG_08080 [Capsaspora owczarzaki ATCC 30864]|uniref:Uncharacterized protein n=1 Tax=Capsaspora owczarzaki (strain ATCC 30864) TaxID=595528 RepID=A0A0D2X5M0_CAPO3|nr:hypothetical protein CAOG_08080 [Capsaspora owczarzaki ATCC 30864]KJE98044.1 hypothetical protein CAOG_008080 [Capsaspora owczarzaki ATCC 30864]|eukprot:XP_004342681.1 hypothetical protein CAOG_08080 [Capsaspora owczarzaki ATCC 30864]
MSGNDNVLAAAIVALPGGDPLRARIRELEAERDALKRELEDARRQHAEAIDRLEREHAEKINELNQSIETLRKELNEVNTKYDKLQAGYDKVQARLDAMEGALALGQIVYDLEEKIVLWVLANDKDKKRRFRLNTVRSLTDPWARTRVPQLEKDEQQRANSVQAALTRVFGDFHDAFKEAKKVRLATAHPVATMSQQQLEALARAHLKDDTLLEDMLKIIEFYHLDVPTIIQRCEAEQDYWQTA